MQLLQGGLVWFVSVWRCWPFRGSFFIMAFSFNVLSYIQNPLLVSLPSLPSQTTYPGKP